MPDWADKEAGSFGCTQCRGSGHDPEGAGGTCFHCKARATYIRDRFLPRAWLVEELHKDNPDVRAVLVRLLNHD